MNTERQTCRIGVVIPCYRVGERVLDVIRRIGPEVEQIFVVDDACPEGAGATVRNGTADPRVHVIDHPSNKGVGGAVITGYRAGFAAGLDIMVKIDGDGQIDPALVGRVVYPILAGRADYAKGNRFHSIYNIRQMPAVRLFGNAALSFMTKISSGYWSVFDPTNGFTAIHRNAFALLEPGNLSERYFFESDMLINLGNIRAVVCDVPMEARYADERSNLRIRAVLGTFLAKNVRESCKRLLYTYFLRDFSLASAQLLFGAVAILFGTVFGLWQWAASANTGTAATTGTVMLATLPIILGFQLLLAFLGFDMGNEPREVLQPSPDLGRLIGFPADRAPALRAAR